MSELISRQAAIDALEREKTYMTAYKDGYIQTDYFKQYNMGLADGIKALNKLPSAERKGKWKRAYLDHEAMGERPSILYCSICDQCIAYPTNYCPNCGADMRGEEDE